MIAGLYEYLRKNLGLSKIPTFVSPVLARDFPEIHCDSYEPLNSQWPTERDWPTDTKKPAKELIEEMMNKLAQRGVVEAMIWHGENFLFGEKHRDAKVPDIGQPLKGPDRARGMAWLKLAAGSGQIRGLYYYGFALYRTLSPEPSRLERQRVMQHLEGAAKKGHGPALLLLGKIYREGFVVIRDLEIALEFEKRGRESTIT